MTETSPIPGALRRTRRRRPAAALLGTAAAAAIAVGVAAVGGIATAAPASSDPVLTVAYVGLASSFPDPVQDEFEAYVGDGEYLLHPVRGGAAPWLAEKADMVDTRTWRITMRRGLRYQDGSAVTMPKVKSWLDHELAASPEFGTKYRGTKTAITGPRTITVRLSRPQANFRYELSNYTLHFYDWDRVRAVGKDFGKLAGMGVYTGPYAITSVSKQKWVYTANPHYWRGKPALQRIELVNVSDAQAALKAVQSGEADVVFFADAALKPTASALKGVHFNPGPQSAEYEALLPNLGKAPWSDPVVRRALALTIDSKRIAQRGSFGVMPEIHGIFPADSQFAYDWVRPDVAKANALLDAAGWVRGSDGVREKNGVRLAGDVLSYGANLNALSVPLAQAAKEAGFSLSPKLLDYQVWADQIKSRKWDLTMQNNENFGINGDVGVSCNLYFGTGEVGASKGAGLDPVIKPACARLRATRSPATLRTVLGAVQRRNAQQAYVIPVTGRTSSWITNDAWRSATPDAFYVPITWETRAG